jgi:hypothetical protein
MPRSHPKDVIVIDDSSDEEEIPMMKVIPMVNVQNHRPRPRACPPTRSYPLTPSSRGQSSTPPQPQSQRDHEVIDLLDSDDDDDDDDGDVRMANARDSVEVVATLMRQDDDIPVMDEVLGDSSDSDDEVLLLPPPDCRNFTPLLKSIVPFLNIRGHGIQPLVHKPDFEQECLKILGGPKVPFTGGVTLGRPIQKQYYDGIQLGVDQPFISGDLVLTSYIGQHPLAFLRIAYFEEVKQDGKPRIMAHCEVYKHSRRTIDMDVGNHRELHETEKCTKINAMELDGAAKLTLLMGPPLKESDHGPRTFFCRTRLMSDGSFVDCVEPPLPEVTVVGRPQCRSCAIQEHLNPSTFFGKVNGKPTLRTRGGTFHPHDYVLIEPSSPGVYHIGQILEMHKSRVPVEEVGKRDDLQMQKPKVVVEVKELGRWDDLTKALTKDFSMWKDEKLVYFTGEHRTVNAGRIARKVVVLTRSDMKGHFTPEFVTDTPDCFYLLEKRPCRLPPGDVTTAVEQAVRIAKSAGGKRCEPCLKEWLVNKAQLLSCPRFNLISLFCSIGLADLGLQDVCKHIWASDMDGEALETHRNWCPGSSAKKEDIYATTLSARKVISHREEGKPLLMVFTPPCQPYSKANRSKDADDPRILLPFAALSIADEVRPHYIIMENVAGIVEHRTRSDDATFDESGKVVSCISRILKEMGYQL